MKNYNIIAVHGYDIFYFDALNSIWILGVEEPEKSIFNVPEASVNIHLQTAMDLWRSPDTRSDNVFLVTL